MATTQYTITEAAPNEPDSPQTGDNSNLWLWAALAFVSGGALFGTILWKKKEESQQN
ncbi:MAG: LPXTG cell wall anchor domain-containing protein [Clostridia bacterium]|nr:LPXTG cell wall anchor domain-containing protein [Clostridia bacterium]